MTMASHFTEKIFWRCRVSRVKFSYWSIFHVDIITGSGVMTIFIYKGLTKNPEIGNTLNWVLLNIWRLERVKETKFSTNVSRYWMLQNARVTAFSVSELLRENQQGENYHRHHPQHPTLRLGLTSRQRKGKELSSIEVFWMERWM